MSGLFEDIALFDDGKRIAQRQAAAVAQKRVSDFVGAFLKKATSRADLEARLSLVEEDVHRIIAETVEEYGGDAEKLEEAIDEHLRGDGVTDLNEELADAPSAVGSKTLASKDDDDDDDDDDEDDKDDKDDDSDSSDSDSDSDDSDSDDKSLPPWLKDKESKTADAPRDGGGAVKTETLPKADNSGLGGPSPKIDKKEWKPRALGDGDGNLKPIDTEQKGSPNPTEHQDVDDTADHSKDFLEQTDAVTEQQSLPSANADGYSTDRNIEQTSTDTFNNNGQADPVTSKVESGTDPDKNPLKSILESGFVTDHQVKSAIQAFEAEKE